ncbi:MAG: alcohol dehydrogenase catalytic domain-containing protein [Pseudomonadota bacterium]
MKALVYTAPETLALQNVPPPQALGETLVDVAFCGICGSDMHAYLGHDERRPAPLTLGHEATGTTRDGRQVVINPLVTCMDCEACLSGRTNLCPNRQIISMPPRPGAFCATVALPERNLLPLPKNLSLEVAALTEPLACGWHAAKLAARHSETPLGEARVLVLGGGAIGLGCALSLAAKGAREIAIFEPNRARWDTIAAAGPFTPVGADEASALAPEVVIDAYGGGRSRALASAVVRPGGIIVHVGLADNDAGLDTRRATLQEITFVGAYTYTAADFAETLDALAAGTFGPLGWTEVRALEDGPAAFADIRAGRVAAAKIILKIN